MFYPPLMLMKSSFVNNHLLLCLLPAVTFDLHKEQPHKMKSLPVFFYEKIHTFIPLTFKLYRFTKIYIHIQALMPEQMQITVVLSSCFVSPIFLNIQVINIYLTLIPGKQSFFFNWQCFTTKAKEKLTAEKR